MKRIVCIFLIFCSALLLSFASAQDRSIIPAEYAEAARKKLSINWEVSTYYIHYNGASSIGNDSYITDEWLSKNSIPQEGYLFAFSAKEGEKSAIAFTTNDGQIIWADMIYDETNPNYISHLENNVVISGTIVMAMIYSAKNDSQYEWYKLNVDMTSSRGTPLKEGEARPQIIPLIFGSANLNGIAKDEEKSKIFTACLVLDCLIQFFSDGDQGPEVDKFGFDSMCVNFLSDLNMAMMYFGFGDDYYMLTYANVLNETIRLKKTDVTPQTARSENSPLIQTYIPEELDLKFTILAILKHLSE